MLRKVKISNGWVEGIPAADPRITAFKGIPFAQPPVGDLRWREPQPVKDWEGVLKCSTFGPIPMQSTPGLGDPEQLYNKEWHVDSDIAISEDCLYLNVWTPAKKEDEKLPVMAWIFGGGMVGGYTSEMEFDGERIARRGVILVSIGYRVNGFGFLAHPELTAESSKGFSGNYGLLDQRAGLEWIQKNIKSFGGDPGNVTVCGQSAGGRSTLCHITSPINEGLFNKAIIQSGGGLMVGYRGFYPQLKTAEQKGIEFFDMLGVSNLKEARKLDAEFVLQKAMEFYTPQYRWGPIVDGYFIKEDPVEAIVAGRQHNIPCIASSTTNDMNFKPDFNTIDDLVEYAKENFGDKSEDYIRLFDSCNGDMDSINQLAKYDALEIGNIALAKEIVRHNQSKIYLSMFGPEMPGDNAGCFHSSDLWFTFETLAKCWRPFKGKHYDLARQMCNYWTNFVKNGDPNGNDNDGTPMPKWKPFGQQDIKLMFFGDTAQMKVSSDKMLDFLAEQEIAAAKRANK